MKKRQRNDGRPVRVANSLGETTAVFGQGGGMASGGPQLPLLDRKGGYKGLLFQSFDMLHIGFT